MRSLSSSHRSRSRVVVKKNIRTMIRTDANKIDHRSSHPIRSWFELHLLNTNHKSQITISFHQKHLGASFRRDPDTYSNIVMPEVGQGEQEEFSKTKQWGF